MTPALRNALDALYEEFRAPTPTRIEGCPCCLDRKDIGVLQATPLRALTADDLASYSASVFLTVGEAADYRFFLPRIFEIAATDLDWWPSPEVVLAKLPMADWRSWKRTEQAAIMKVIDAWFDDCAASSIEAWGENDQSLDSVLCGIGRAGLDPVVYLDRLVSEGRDFALCMLWEANAKDIRRRERMSNEFWEDDAVDAAVVARLLADDIQAIVA